MESNINTGLLIDQKSFSFLEEIRRWANFLAIMGFIGVGIIIIIALFIGNFLEKFAGQASVPMPTGLITSIYLLIAALYFFPVLYLFRFSVKMKMALHQNSQENLTGAFENLKSLFRFMGIFTIVILSLYMIVIISLIVFEIVTRV